MLRRLGVPAILCDMRGVIIGANAGGRHILGAVKAVPGWPPQMHELFIGSERLRRYPMTDGEWLLVAVGDVDAPPTERIYRSMRDTLYRVISTIAHDLRSPLASLFFNVGVLQARWRTLPPDEVDRTLDAMSRACELEMKAVAGLVERIGSEPGEGTDLVALFERIEELLSPLFRDKDNTLGIVVDPDARVAAAPMVLEQIFVNLIRNAVESRHDPVRVDVSVVCDESTVRVRIANDGPPIPRATQARIFRPFFSTKPTGTGMGLVFAREAARDLGGDLRILPGSRTIFEVALPLDKGGAA